MTDARIASLVSSYVAVWNEPDPEARRRTIAELWSTGAVEFTDSREHIGHEALEARIVEAHEQFVAGRSFTFVLAGEVMSHHQSVTFEIHMVPTSGGPPVWTGVVVLLLDDAGQIRTDIQFVSPETAVRSAVAELLARIGDGDPARIAELFAETVDWQLDWPSGSDLHLPWIRDRRTRADVADHFRELDEHHGPSDLSPAGGPVRVLVDGTDAIVAGELRRTAKNTGRPYMAKFALHLTFVDGLIIRYHVYEDSLSVALAFSAVGLAAAS